jgi:hypothetical protein
MQHHGSTTHVIAGAALALVFTFTAQAQNNRSFVATTGDDTNNCSASAYCRTFGRALAVTNSGGEIVVVNSGGYAPATISQPVTITAIGIDASIIATSANALTINTTGDVTITGLNLNGLGIGTNGVHVKAVGVLRLYNMQIESFTNNGIDFLASGNLDVYNSKINDCGIGLFQNAGQVYVRKSGFDSNNGAGAESDAGTMAIADSFSHYNTIGFYANGGTMALYNNGAVFNTVGIASAMSGTLYFAHSLLSGNTQSSSVVEASMFGSSPGTSLVTPGQTTVGTPGMGIVLH